MGTRNPSKIALNVTSNIVEAFKDYSNITIVSGLAKGIDAQSHKSALSFGLPTIAILPNGLYTLEGKPIIYPLENKDLWHKVSKLTEYEVNHRPRKYTFIKRNRIIAALADLFILVESPLQKENGGAGAINAMNYAKHLKKKIVVIDINTPQASGNQRIIESIRTANPLFSLNSNIYILSPNEIERILELI